MDKKIENLQSQLQNAVQKKDSLSEELNNTNIIIVKIQGALEILNELVKEENENKNKNKKKEGKSD